MKIFDSKFNFANSNEQNGSQLFIEQKAVRRIDRIAESGVGKSSIWSLTELAWTAGPVTYVAAQGGYYIGFGTWLPTENMIFFIVYTILMGLIAVLVKFIYRATKGQDIDDAKERLVLVLGTLPDMLLSTRDLYLNRMDSESRRYESARLLLQKSDLGPEWLSVAVKSITESSLIAKTIEEIEIYWRAGMHSRIKDVNEERADEIEEALEGLREERPRLAELVSQRLQGKKNSLHSGVEREPYFIERIFSAIEEDNADIISLSDVEEMMVLLFELLSGRRIPMLYVMCVGSQELEKATETLEQERSHYRIVRARAYSQLLALANYLSENNLLDYSTVAERLPSQDLLDICTETIDELTESVVDDVQGVMRRDQVNVRHLKLQNEILNKAVMLYKLAYQESKKVETEHADFLRDIQKWQRVMHRYGETKAHVSILEKRGLTIKERAIFLDDTAKLDVIKSISSHFNSKTHLMRGMNAHYDARAKSSDRLVNASKQFAIDIALALEPHINLSMPRVQRAIDTSNAIDLGGFEPGVSTTTKIGWGVAMAKEIQKDMGKASEQLVFAIHRYYGVKLGVEELNHLNDMYGINSDNVLEYYEVNAEESKDSNIFEPKPPLQIPATKQRWHSALRQYKRYV